MTGAGVAQRILISAVLLTAFATVAHAAGKAVEREAHAPKRVSQRIQHREHEWQRMQLRAIISSDSSVITSSAASSSFTIGVDNLEFQAGAAVVRQDTCWECVQPTRATWDWSYDDALHRELGSRWLPVLDFAPQWAGGGGYIGCLFGSPFLVRTPPTDIGAYAAFVRAFVQRYRPSTVEVWNEPDIYMFMYTSHPGPTYRQMYLAAYLTIKQVSPHTKVLLAGDDETNGDWFLPSLAGVPADGVSAHPYAGTPAGVAALVHHDEQLVAQLHIRAPMYLTEVGLTGVYCTTPATFLQIVSALAHDPDVRLIDAYFCLPRQPIPIPPGTTTAAPGAPTICGSMLKPGVYVAHDGTVARKSREARKVRLRWRH